MDKIKEYAKTIVTFLATLAINCVISLVQGDQPWPQTQQEWIRYLGTAFTAALATGIPRNKVTEKQVEKGIQKGDLTPAVVSVIAERTSAPTTPVAVLPSSEQPTVVANPIQPPPLAYQSTTEGSYPLQPMKPEPPTLGGSVVDDIIAGYQGKHRAGQ